jgi:hypothetical protein
MRATPYQKTNVRSNGRPDYGSKVARGIRLTSEVRAAWERLAAQVSTFGQKCRHSTAGPGFVLAHPIVCITSMRVASCGGCTDSTVTVSYEAGASIIRNVHSKGRSLSYKTP